MTEKAGVKASVETQSLIIHTSTANLGGGEQSLLEWIDFEKIVPHFIVPDFGPLSTALETRKLSFEILGWPAGLQTLSQKKFFRFPIVLLGMFHYTLQLVRIINSPKNRDSIIWSSGIKSHCFCLLLSPWLRKRLVFDIRDFIKPSGIKKMLALSMRLFGCRANVNSKAVGKDYSFAKVVYPIVNGIQFDQSTEVFLSQRATGLSTTSTNKKIITHLAYFAPYKGQDLFLECARKLLDANVNTEFWLVGDVIYPAPEYARYREKIYTLLDKLKLREHVRFLGKISDRKAIEEILKQTDLLLHCTLEPEPYGRSVMEALQNGCEVICHRGSGVCETTDVYTQFPTWAKGIESLLGPNYVSLKLRS